MWIGGHTNRPSVDVPWLRKLVSGLIALSIVGTLMYVVEFTMGTSDFGLISTASAEDNKRKDYKALRKQMTHIYRSRPARIDEPLRENNVSDDEIRQIQAATSAVYPGAIANISGVTAGCPCEDGLTCDSQVWVLAYRDSRYDGLMLSRIENSWTVGPLQSWWLEYDKLSLKMRAERRNKNRFVDGTYFKLLDEQQALQEIFPFCDDES